MSSVGELKNRNAGSSSTFDAVILEEEITQEHSGKHRSRMDVEKETVQARVQKIEQRALAQRGKKKQTATQQNQREPTAQELLTGKGARKNPRRVFSG